MQQQTQSELLFESFCNQNALAWERVEPGAGKTPDYRLRFGSACVAVEVEQIESIPGYKPGGIHSVTVGRHVRQKINEARKQLQAVAASREPAVLLIFNAVDPLQLLGSDQRDFLCAMYGELTVTVSPSHGGRPFYGRNARLRHDTNTSFSAVGHLRQTPSGATVTLYENVFSAYPLPFAALPTCLDVVRVSVQDAT